MKATEWADKFSAIFAGHQQGDIFNVVSDFVEECVTLVRDRTKLSFGHKHVKAVTEGALREAAAKWRAICARCPKVSFGFDQIEKQIRKRIQ